MKYNTQEKRLPVPEYGRAVQKMVDHALTIEDRKERQRCAETIIKVMGSMFPQLRDVPEFKHKLWDHLAIMADFKLDIDFPYELVDPATVHPTPQRIAYPKGKIRFRHYGRCLENMVRKACEMPEGKKRDELFYLLATQMKKEYVIWNKDSVEDARIVEDIFEYSGGKIRLSEKRLNLGKYHAPKQQQQNGSKNKNKKKKNKNKNKNFQFKNKKKFNQPQKQ